MGTAATAAFDGLLCFFPLPLPRPAFALVSTVPNLRAPFLAFLPPFGLASSKAASLFLRLFQAWTAIIVRAEGEREVRTEKRITGINYLYLRTVPTVMITRSYEYSS